MRVVPTRQGTHLPQLSSAVNLRKNLAKSTMQVVSSTTTMPPEPIMEPAATRLSKSMGSSSSEGGRQPPGGPAQLHGLELAARQHAAADVEDDLAQSGAHGHLDQPAVHHLAGEREDLGALAGGGAHGGELLGAVVDDPGHVGVGLHVVEVGGLAPEAVRYRADVLAAGHAPLPLDGSGEGGRLAADERPRALVDADVEAETRPEDVLAQEVALARLARARRSRSTANGYSWRTYT